jgi:hypothetical protein
MENFMLWGFGLNPAAKSLLFRATRIQHQCINQGTREMIDQMLVDAGSPKVDYTDWSVRYFLNNYFSSVDEPISSRDAWSKTWEISLNLKGSSPDEASFPNDDREVLRTYAIDMTWDGENLSLAAPCIMIARFYSKKLFNRAFAALSEFEHPRGSKDPEVQDLIDALKQDPSSSLISVRKRVAVPMEVAVEFGTFNDNSFSSDGSRLAEKLSEVIHEFGATITWDEKAAYFRNQPTS